MYRICTEDVNRSEIESIIAQNGVDGYAILTGSGYWKGQRENALTLEFINTDVDTVRSIALAIKNQNKQEAVLIQHVPIEAEFV